MLDWATRPLAKDRSALISSATGRVLELGVGNGANFSYYSEQASEIHGIEPAKALLDAAHAAASSTLFPDRFHLIQAGAENLPYPDNHYDTLSSCLVFCTIPDADAAAKETLRVLKPGGKLLVLEHVAHEKPLWRRSQKLIEPVWTPMACGCHLSRDTLSRFTLAGFDTSGLRQWQHPKLPRLAGFMLSGIAVKP